MAIVPLAGPVTALSPCGRPILAAVLAAPSPAARGAVVGDTHHDERH